MKNIKRHSRLTKVKPYLFVLILAVAIFAVLETTNTTHLLHKAKPLVTPVATNDIHQLPSQPAANDGMKVPTTSSSINQGTSTNGVSNSEQSTNPSQWTISQSGLVTVKQPTNTGTIASGAAVSGSTTVEQLQYTLIDDQVGVISQGPLTVTNGAFSASISFHSYAKTGRLDVFSTDPNGKEINLAQVSVKFQ